jgi:hypothetical protein
METEPSLSATGRPAGRETPGSSFPTCFRRWLPGGVDGVTPGTHGAFLQARVEDASGRWSWKSPLADQFLFYFRATPD